MTTPQVEGESGRPPRADIAKTTVACNSCGRSDAEVIATGKEHEYRNTTNDVFQFVRCRCGLVYLNPRPAVSELDVIYPPDYYAYRIIEQRQKMAGGKGSTLSRLMGARALQRLRPYVDRIRATGPGPYRILDIGCGDGTTLNGWREAFSGEAETYGIEMNEHAAAIANGQGHKVTPKRVEESELPPGFFDFVYSFHLIEHVEDPKGFMRGVRTAMKPSGYTLIETPNVDCLDFRMFRKGHWGAYHFPRHWNLYDAATFGSLAKETGFEVVDVSYLPAAVFWIWTMHSMLNARSPRLADALFPPVDVFVKGSPWIWALMATFTAVEFANLFATKRSSVMRVLLRAA